MNRADECYPQKEKFSAVSRSGFTQDANNFSPRIGLAYSPSRRWVLRVGYGIFFDRYVLANLNRAIEKNGVQAFEQVADGDAAATVFQTTAGGPLAAQSAAIAHSIFRANLRLATPYSQQASVGAEYPLAHDLAAIVNYLLVRGVKLPRAQNTNLLLPVVLAPQNAALLGVLNPTPQQLGRPVFGPGRSDPLLDAIYQGEDSASSTYQGLTVSLNRRMADESEFLVGCTLSRTVDDASDFDEQPENPFNLRVEHGLARQHQQHRFVFNALWELPIGEEERRGSNLGDTSGVLTRAFNHLELGAILTIESGRPVNPLTGVDSGRGHTIPLSARPLGFGRNSLNVRELATVDLRVLKYFRFGESARLDLVAESFNLPNRTNVVPINPVFGSNLTPLAGLGRPLAGRGARQIQFSIDFEF
jgi:hypothetical protein